MEVIDLWLQREEELGEEELDKEDEFLIAFGDEDLPPTDEEVEEWDDDEKDNGEFNQFTDYDPEEFGFSYTQLEHVSFGDPEMGTMIGGKFAKLEKIIQMQTVSKEKLYTNKLKADLNTYFSFDTTNHYAALVQKIPRFWLKNTTAMAAAIFMIDSLGGNKPSADSLNEFSIQTGIRKEDLYRYYRLIKEYIGNI